MNTTHRDPHNSAWSVPRKASGGVHLSQAFVLIVRHIRAVECAMFFIVLTFVVMFRRLVQFDLCNFLLREMACNTLDVAGICNTVERLVWPFYLAMLAVIGWFACRCVFMPELPWTRLVIGGIALAICWDNAPTESFLSSLKTERKHHAHYNELRKQPRPHEFSHFKMLYDPMGRYSTLNYCLGPATYYRQCLGRQELVARKRMSGI